MRVVLPTAHHKEDDDESIEVPGALLQRRRQETHALIEAQQLDELECAEEDQEADHVAERLPRRQPR